MVHSYQSSAVVLLCVVEADAPVATDTAAAAAAAAAVGECSSSTCSGPAEPAVITSGSNETDCSVRVTTATEAGAVIAREGLVEEEVDTAPPTDRCHLLLLEGRGSPRDALPEEEVAADDGRELLEPDAMVNKGPPPTTTALLPTVVLLLEEEVVVTMP